MGKEEYSSKDQPNLIKYVKRGLKSLLDPTQFAAGALVEAVRLDENSNETTEKYFGRVDKIGDVCERNSDVKGMSLGRPGVYLIKFYGGGMEYIPAGGSVPQPYQEIYDISNSKGFTTNIPGGRRMEIDFANSQLKWYDDEDQLVAYCGFFSDGSGNIVPAIKVTNEGNAVASYAGEFSSINGAAAGEVRTIKVYAEAEQPNAGIFKIHDKIDDREGAVIIAGKTGTSKLVGILLGDGLTVIDIDYFIHSAFDIQSFHRGKLGIGSDDVDVPEAIVHIGAGTSSYPQIILDPGVFKTVPRKGSFESDGNRLAYTDEVDRRFVSLANDVITTEVSFSNTKVLQTLQQSMFSANDLKDGKMIKFCGMGKFSLDAGDTLQFQFSYGDGASSHTNIFTYTVDNTFVVSPLTDKPFYFELIVTVLGGGGSGEFVAFLRGSINNVNIDQADNNSQVYDMTNDMAFRTAIVYSNNSVTNSIVLYQTITEVLN